jgi:hypothetical protein
LIPRYSETVDLLYSRNTFHFSNARYPVGDIPTRVLPHRWNAIRSIYVTFYFPCLAWTYSRPKHIQFFETCDTMAGMPNLRKVAIGLVLHQDSNTPDARGTQAHILHHLTNIKVRGKYDVYVTWEMDEIRDVVDVTKLPYNIYQFSEKVTQFHRGQPLNNFMRLLDRTRD